MSRKMNNFVKAASLLATVMISGNAYAWNSFGHMESAAIAYNRLTVTAKRKVDELLKSNPQYKRWTLHIPVADKAKIAFIKASTWPDEIKDMKGYRNDHKHPNSSVSSRNMGYSDHFEHRYWHFINVPFSPDHTSLARPTAPNAETEIALFRKTISSRDSSDALKSYDLVWLVHLVGDVHQPLHTACRFTKTLPHGDEGGNKIKVCISSCGMSLHAYWDEILGTSDNPYAAIKAAKFLPKADPKLAAISSEDIWVKESFNAAKEYAYAPPIGTGRGPYTLNNKYRTAAHVEADERIELAGERLANLINAAFK